MAEEEFRQQLGECYLTMLQKEREFLDSDEAIDEMLRYNDYEFTEDGKLA